MERQIRILRASALACTLDGIGPLLADENEILFPPQTVTADAAQRVFSTFRETFPDDHDKEAALNPTNPSDRANALETSMIERFRGGASLEQIATVLTRDDGRYFTMAFPLTVNNPGCLTCHSTPEAAAPAMIGLYGPDNGFGWRLGETIGARIISAPMSLVDARAQTTVGMLIGALSLALLLVLRVTNRLLIRILVRPVRLMSEVAEKVTSATSTSPNIPNPAATRSARSRPPSTACGARSKAR